MGPERIERLMFYSVFVFFSAGYKSTKARDFRVSGNSHYSGMMSGYVCGENIPIEALEELEDHFISYPDLEDSDFGVNIELFGGRSFPG